MPKATPKYNLKVLYPMVAKEWHPTKNGDLKPQSIAPKSHKKIWWKCPKSDQHDWEASIKSRTHGSGCTSCSGNKVSPDNNLAAMHPKIAEQWHPIKNGDSKPDGYTSGSNIRIWWKCPKSDQHDWEARIKSRTRGTGCPSCSGNKISPDNNLAAMHPKIAEQWHPIKNGDSKPDGYTSGSGKSFWWKCPKGEDHEWQTNIANRVRDRGCPFCSGRNASKRNNLLILDPALAKEWHPTKNNHLKPENSTSGSGKSVWWKCPKGDDHEWKAGITTRYRGNGCPFCDGKRVSKTNNFAAMHPKIAEQWHPIKNGDSKPDGYTSGSNIRIWWKCPKGHHYRSAITERTRKDKPTGCPECSGNKVGKDNNLQIVNPKVAKEWHPTKNGNLMPKDITYGSNKKVWWLCPKQHEYPAVIKERTRRDSRVKGCPYCSGRKK